MAKSKAAQKDKKAEKCSWIVRVRCVVIKEVVTGDCTEEEASKAPLSLSIDEVDEELLDCETLSVKRNE